MAAKKVRRGKTKTVKTRSGRTERVKTRSGKRVTTRSDMIDAVASGPLPRPDETRSTMASDAAAAVAEAAEAAATAVAEAAAAAASTRWLSESLAPYLRRNWVQVTWLCLILALMIAMFAVSIFSGGASSRLANRRVSELENLFAKQVKINSDALDFVATVHNSLSAKIDALTSIPEDIKVSAVLSQLDSSLEQLEERMKTLESAILANPGKALEIPLIQNDIDHMKKERQSDVASLRQEIARVYDLNKWFVGLMFTMVLAMIGFVVTNVVKGATAGNQTQ